VKTVRNVRKSCMFEPWLDNEEDDDYETDSLGNAKLITLSFPVDPFKSRR
jgi:hypothetical protein